MTAITLQAASLTKSENRIYLLKNQNMMTDFRKANEKLQRSEDDDMC